MDAAAKTFAVFTWNGADRKPELHELSFEQFVGENAGSEADAWRACRSLLVDGQAERSERRSPEPFIYQMVVVDGEGLHAQMADWRQERKLDPERDFGFEFPAELPEPPEAEPGGEPLIAATAASDDGVLEVTFDAAPYFEEASDKEIVALATSGYGPGEAANAVASLLAQDSDPVAFLFAYLEESEVGFSCQVSSDAAEAWLSAHRSQLLGSMAASVEQREA